LASDIISTFGLTGRARQTLTDTLAVAQRSQRTASVVGLAGLLWSGLGVVAAMEFALDSSWDVSGRGFKDRLWGLAWLAGAGVILMASSAVTGVVGYLPAVAAVLAAPLSIALGPSLDIALWLWTLTVPTNEVAGDPRGSSAYELWDGARYPPVGTAWDALLPPAFAAPPPCDDPGWGSA